MKKIILVVLLSLAFALAGFTTASAHGRQPQASGDMVTRTMDVPNFDGVKAQRGVTVILSDEITDKIAIIADADLMDHVDVSLHGSTLVATIDGTVRNIRGDVTVTIPARANLRLLEVSSAGRITSNGVLASDKMSLDASSAGTIDVGLNVPSCDLDASSAAKIDCYITAQHCEVEGTSAAHIILKGTAAQAGIEMSSAAKLSAGEFAVVDCTVDASSAASATVNATGVFRADASSGASIRNAGKSATNNISKSSGGSVSY